ncbi:MAG: membrane dipeptidase [Anaerolineae bacterium]|nr:membrane dipeptidase [Anaerolineae bacterium]
MNADKLHRESIVFDGHCDTLLEVLDGERRLGEQFAGSHLDLPRMIQGGVTAQIFACFVRPRFMAACPTAQALRIVDTFFQEMAANEAILTLATSAADIERAKAEGKIAGVLGLEGAEALVGDLGVLRMFYRLGVRSIGLTWNFRNEAADGVDEARTGGGLTEFGVQLVKEMNRLGIMIDIAHLAPAGVRDVLTLSEAPVIASHANARALCPHRRNLSDEQLEGIAANGGVVGVTFVPAFVSEDPAQATLERTLDHIDHIVRVAGIDHVGLGSDFDGFPQSAVNVGLEDVTRLPNITAGLLARGYKPAEVKKILGGNFLRVFRQVVG